jgi:hypothetical protein
VREVIVGVVLQFPYLHLFTREVATSGVWVPDEHGFEEADEVGFVSGGSVQGEK